MPLCYIRVCAFPRICFAMLPCMQLTCIVCVTNRTCTVPFLVTYVVCTCNNINLSNSTTGTHPLGKYVHTTVSPYTYSVFCTYDFYRRSVPYGKVTCMCVYVATYVVFFRRRYPFLEDIVFDAHIPIIKNCILFFFVNEHLQSVFHTQ